MSFERAIDEALECFESPPPNESLNYANHNGGRRVPQDRPERTQDFFARRSSEEVLGPGSAQNLRAIAAVKRLPEVDRSNESSEHENRP